MEGDGTIMIEANERTVHTIFDERGICTDMKVDGTASVSRFRDAVIKAGFPSNIFLLIDWEHNVYCNDKFLRTAKNRSFCAEAIKLRNLANKVTSVVRRDSSFALVMKSLISSSSSFEKERDVFFIAV